MLPFYIFRIVLGVIWLFPIYCFKGLVILKEKVGSISSIGFGFTFSCFLISVLAKLYLGFIYWGTLEACGFLAEDCALFGISIFGEGCGYYGVIFDFIVEDGAF